MKVQPYLFFAGNCEAAINFYQTTLGATLQFLMRFGDMPTDEAHQEGCVSASDFAPNPNLIMHANLLIGESQIMLSDDPSGSQHAHTGYALSIACRDVAEGKRLFDALLEEGQVSMPWGETFWALGFGMLKDKFGVHWMINVERPQTGA